MHASTELDSLYETCLEAALTALAPLQYTLRLHRRQPTRRRVRLAGARGARRCRARHEQGRAPVSCGPPARSWLSLMSICGVLSKRVPCPDPHVARRASEGSQFVDGTDDIKLLTEFLRCLGNHGHFLTLV